MNGLSDISSLSTGGFNSDTATVPVTAVPMQTSNVEQNECDHGGVEGAHPESLAPNGMALKPHDFR